MTRTETSAMPGVSDDEVAATHARAKALIETAQYELARTEDLLKKLNYDPIAMQARMTDADRAEVQRRIEEGQRAIDESREAARLAIEQSTPMPHAARRSRLMRNLV